MSQYSSIFHDHFQAPRHAGSLESPDRIGKSSLRGRAPYTKIYLRFEDERVSDLRFQTFGCGAAIASCSILSEMAIGKTFAECLAITHEQVEEALGGLPRSKKFCARLAVLALHNGVSRELEEATEE